MCDSFCPVGTVPTILQGLRIDDGHGLVEFRGHVEHAAGPIVNRAMRPYSMAKINLAGDLAAGDIDHHHLPAIGSRLAHPRASVDGHIGGLAIRRGSHFVASDAAFGHSSQLLGSGRVDDAQVAVALVGGHQHRLYGCLQSSRGVDHGKRQGQDQADRGKT